jgi:high-affinity nickel-transport protein
MSFALLFSAFGYGLRHGFDWDHIAALTDISSVEKSKKRAFLLSSFYAMGHAAVVMVLGVAIILADFTVPESVDTTLMYFIGFSLIALGVWVLTGIFFQGSNFRLKSRWMLIRDGLFKGLKRIQRTSSGRSISVEHSHGHEHERDFELHDHAHGVKATDSSHRHVHKHELLLDNESISSPTAIGVGVLHGIGVETPTQIAIFVATTQATGKAGGLLILLFWVVGLILANSAIALLSIGANNWRRTHTVFYRVLAAIIGIVSVIVGILVLIEKDGILPAF